MGLFSDIEYINKMKKKNAEYDAFMETQQKRKAIIEQVAPETSDENFRYGMVKLRVAGVHTPSKTELPTKDLPWQKVAFPVGSGGGIGSNVNLVVGQWVEVQAENPACTSWKVVGSSPIIPSDATPDDDESFGDVSPEGEKQVSKTLIPIMGTGKELLNTVGKTLATGGSIYALVNQAALVFTTDNANGNAPVPANLIVAKPGDWTFKEVSRTGANLGSFNEFITVGGLPLNYQFYDVKLVNEGTNNSPGNIIGLDLDGNTIFCNYLNNNLYVPPVVTPGEYIIKYRVEEKANLLNFAESTITINVTDEPLPKEFRKNITRREILPPLTINDPIRDHRIEEPKDTADKAQPHLRTVRQTPDFKVMEVTDATPGNETYGVTHLTDKEDPNSISRIEMNALGEMIHKAAGDMYLISKNNLLQYVENAVEQTIRGYLSINAPTIFLKGDIRIEGNLVIEGDITHTGDQTTSGTITGTTDVVAGTIKLKAHTHAEPTPKAWKDSTEKSTDTPTSG